jgi:hypothetical protein
MKTLCCAATLTYIFCCMGMFAFAQSPPNSIATPRPFDPGSNTTNPSSFAVQTQNPFLGSVPIAPLVPGTLDLNMRYAASLALRVNLGHIEAEQEHRETLAARLNALSKLLPNIAMTAHKRIRLS